MFDIHFTPEPPLAGVADDGWAERIAVPDPVVEPQFYGGPPPTQVDERLDAEARHVHLLRALGLRPAPGSNTAVAMEPGPRLIQLLTDIPLGTVSTGVRVAWLVAWQCCQGWVEAQAQAAIAVTAGPEPLRTRC